MKHTILALTFLALTACGSNSSTSEKSAPVPTPAQDAKKVTTRVECQGGMATSLYDAWAWRTVFQAPRITFTMNFKFARNGWLTLSNNCNFDGVGELSTSTGTNFADDGSTIQIFANAHNEETANGLSCEVSVQAAKISYSFEGRCLVLHDPTAGELFLLPN